MKIVLYEPEEGYNAGNIGRTCVLTDTELHLIKPLGFKIDDKEVKRAGMDYWKNVKLFIWENYEEFLKANEGARIFYATTKAKTHYTDVEFRCDDFIMFGPESRGIPESILYSNDKYCITIPMKPIGRSLNLSNSAAIILYEALRQQNFKF